MKALPVLPWNGDTSSVTHANLRMINDQSISEEGHIFQMAGRRSINGKVEHDVSSNTSGGRLGSWQLRVLSIHERQSGHLAEDLFHVSYCGICRHVHVMVIARFPGSKSGWSRSYSWFTAQVAVYVCSIRYSIIQVELSVKRLAGMTQKLQANPR